MEELLEHDQEHTENPSKFPSMFTASSLERMHQPPIDMLLDEILDIQVFSKYFDYHSWMWLIMPVCKKWQRICERSRMPKQLTIRKRITRPFTIKIIAKHQPEIIQVDYGKDRVRPKLSIYSLLPLVNASKRCHTLVLSFPILQAGVATLESQKLPQITTLCIHENDLHCLEFFPNVQNLQIHNVLEKKLERKMIPNSVEYLSVRRGANGLVWIFRAHPDYVFLSLLDTDPHDNRDDAERMNDWLKNKSYGAYFRQYSVTKMAKLVHAQRFDDVRKLLQTQETTLQRELELSNDQRIYRTQKMDSLKHYDYVFNDHPFCVTQAWVSFFDVENFYEKEIARDFYEQMATCSIEVRPDVKLNLIAKFGTAKEAINAIKRLTNDHMKMNTTHALYNLIVREDVRHQLLKKPIFKIFLRTLLGANCSTLLDHCKDVEIVNKLAEFVDWSEFLPRYVSGCTTKEVFAHAVRMSIQHGTTTKYNDVQGYRSLCSYLKDSDDWSVFDELLEANSTLLDSFMKSITNSRTGLCMTKDLYIKVLKRYKYDVNEIAVRFVQCYVRDIAEFTKEFKVDWKIAVEKANDTPYFHLVSDAHMNQKLHNLLQNGVDPRFFPKDGPSIISHFILNDVLSTGRKVALIDTLLAFGVDINEPSVNFMNQKHTPLNLAKLLPKPNVKLIEHLEARGALPDEEIMMN